jgi:hypothetical protein
MRYLRKESDYIIHQPPIWLKHKKNVNAYGYFIMTAVERMKVLNNKVKIVILRITQ